MHTHRHTQRTSSLLTYAAIPPANATSTMIPITMAYYKMTTEMYT